MGMKLNKVDIQAYMRDMKDLIWRMSKSTDPFHRGKLFDRLERSFKNLSHALNIRKVYDHFGHYQYKIVDVFEEEICPYCKTDLLVVVKK